MDIDSKTAPMLCLPAPEGYFEVQTFLTDLDADESCKRKLHVEVENCNLEKLKTLVENGSIINYQKEDGETPLHLAFKRQRYDIILYLLQMGADINTTDIWMNTPLHYLRCPAFISKLSSSLEILMQSQHETEGKAKRNVFGELPFINWRSFRDNTDAVDCFGNTSLHCAVGAYNATQISYIYACKKPLAALSYLMACGADINAQNIFGHTPLHISVINHQKLSVVEACLRYANQKSITIKDNRGRNFWHILGIHLLLELPPTCKTDGYICSLFSNLIKTLVIPISGIYDQDDTGRTPLHYAAMRRNCALCQFYIEAGCNIKAQDIHGCTPVHYAYKDMETIMALFRKCPKVRWIKDNYGMEAVSANFLEDGKSRRVRNESKNDLISALMDVFRDPEFIIIESTISSFKLRSNFNYPYEHTIAVQEKFFDKLGFPLKNGSDFIWMLWSKLDYAYTQKYLKEISFQVNCFIERLALWIGRTDQRFQGHIEHVGSAFEGTKIKYPNEFDYMFVLENFSEICAIFNSPVCPKGFVHLRRKCTDKQENNYDDFFNESKVLLTNIVGFHFQVILQQILNESEFWKSENIFELNCSDLPVHNSYNIIPNKICTTITLQPRGPWNRDKLIPQISVDIVPSIHIAGWWPDEALQCFDDEITSAGCHLVFDHPQRLYPWIPYSVPYARISFSFLESKIIRNCSVGTKAAYMVGKQILTMCGDNIYTKYVVKSALMYCIDPAGKRILYQRKTSLEELTQHDLFCCARKMFRCVLLFVIQDFVPCYFIPTFCLPVLHNEQYLKFSHAYLHLSGTNLYELFYNECNVTENYILTKIKKSLAISYLVYSLLLDSHTQIKMMPSSPNPFSDKFDRDNFLRLLNNNYFFLPAFPSK